MPSHNSKYYCKSITRNKVKSQSIHKFFTCGGTSNDREQLSVHEIDVSKKRLVTLCKRNFSSLSVFIPNHLRNFTFVLE